MKKIAQNESKLLEIVSNDLKLPVTIIKNDSKWPKMRCCTKMKKSGSKWLKVTQNDSKWLKIVWNDSKITKYDLQWLKMTKND